MTDFASAVAVLAVYLLFVGVGRVVMSKREPIDSYPVRFAYNLIQVKTGDTTKWCNKQLIVVCGFVFAA